MQFQKYTVSCLLLLLLGVVDSIPQNIPELYSSQITGANGSYNSFTHQTGFCKFQGFNSVSRSTTNGPRLLTSGDVFVGVGLSHVQFGEGVSNNWHSLPDGAAACGMCLLVTHVENMPFIDNELNTWDYDKTVTLPFYAMVIDQCNDEVCKNGYLDFDVYSESQPVKHGNPYNITWQAVDCPVGNGTLEYLICPTNACNVGSADVDPWTSIFSPYYFSITVRNSRIPIIGLNVKHPTTSEFIPLVFNTGIGWVWSGQSCGNTLTIQVTSADNQVLVDTVPLGELLSQPSSPGYKGGMMYNSSQQFAPSRYAA